MYWQRLIYNNISARVQQPDTYLYDSGDNSSIAHTGVQFHGSFREMLLDLMWRNNGFTSRCAPFPYQHHFYFGDEKHLHKKQSRRKWKYLKILLLKIFTIIPHTVATGGNKRGNARPLFVFDIKQKWALISANLTWYKYLWLRYMT